MKRILKKRNNCISDTLHKVSGDIVETAVKRLCYGIVLILESTKYIIKFLGLKINFFNFRNINTL